MTLDAVLITLVGGASVGFNRAYASFGAADPRFPAWTGPAAFLGLVAVPFVWDSFTAYELGLYLLYCAAS